MCLFKVRSLLSSILSLAASQLRSETEANECKARPSSVVVLDPTAFTRIGNVRLVLVLTSI
jgi:hypothetical protein